jgi:hypothetical protein
MNQYVPPLKLSRWSLGPHPSSFSNGLFPLVNKVAAFFLNRKLNLAIRIVNIALKKEDEDNLHRATVLQ